MRSRIAISLGVLLTILLVTTWIAVGSGSQDAGAPQLHVLGNELVNASDQRGPLWHRV